MANIAKPADLASEEFCYLTTTGRVSGLPREIEIWFGVIGTTIYMLSGARDRSNWVRNILRTDEVNVRISGETFNGHGRVVDAASKEDATARRLLVDKYQSGYAGDLSEWGRTSLPIAIDIKE